MAKRNKDYWQARAEQKVLDCEKMILDYEKRVKRAFFYAVKDLEKEITQLYAKYAKDNKLSYSETLKYLGNDERLAFQKDLTWYIKHAEKPKYRNEYRQELQALSVRARVKRIEQMKANIITESERLFQKLQKGMPEVLETVYETSYYRTVFDTFQGFGMGRAFDKPSKSVIDTLLSYPWSGKAYSENLWDIEKGFIDGLNRVMTTGLIRGQSVSDMSKALRDEALGRDFGKGKAGGQLVKAQRLARTEASFILNQAAADSYKELGVEQYEFLGTLDSRTCGHCGGLDGKHYPVGEENTGVNYPPLHPYCRCTTVPYFPEDEEETGTRIARDAEGRNYHVPADMTYEEWRDGLQYQGEKAYYTDVETVDIVSGDKVKVSRKSISAAKRTSNRILADFPALKDGVYKVTFSSEDDDGPGGCYLSINRTKEEYGQVIVLNSNLWSDYRSLKKRHRNEWSGKTHIRSKYVESIIAHEFGHAIFNSAALKQAGCLQGDRMTKEQLLIYHQSRDKIKKEIRELCFPNMTDEEIKKRIISEVSERAASDISEFIAECISDYYYGESPSIYAKIVFDALKGRF